MARLPVAPQIYSLQVQQLHWMLRLLAVDSRITPDTLKRANQLTTELMRVLIDVQEKPLALAK